MTKAELIERLKVLGEQLGREVLLTGTVEELSLRVAELEEELGEDSNGEGTEGNTGDDGSNTSDNDTNSSEGDTGDFVKVIPLTTLHIHALAEFDDTVIPIAIAGTTIRVPRGDVESLRKRKLIKLAN